VDLYAGLKVLERATERESERARERERARARERETEDRVTVCERQGGIRHVAGGMRVCECPAVVHALARIRITLAMGWGLERVCLPCDRSCVCARARVCWCVCASSSLPKH
jgi:hypothetical protein